MTQVIIEEEKLQNNIDVIKAQLQKSNNNEIPQIIAVLKGNSYGLTNEILSKKLLENGINYFAVSEVQEGIELRNIGIDKDILVLNDTNVEEEINLAIENNLVLSCGSIDKIKLVDELSGNTSKNTKIHLAIDTGFSRFGFLTKEFTEDNFNEIVSTINTCNNISLEGIFTHFYESYSNSPKSTETQFDIFVKTISKFESLGLSFKLKHCCNSSAFFKYPHMYLNAVRIGSAFAGRLQIKEATGLKRVGYLETELCEIRTLPKGSVVGYSGTYRLRSNKRVGVCEAGYVDGMMLSGPKDCVRLIDKLRNLKTVLKSFFKDTKIYVDINGNKVPVLGRIGMKNFVVDLSGMFSNIPTKVGDKVKIDIKIALVNLSVKRVLR